MSDYFKPDERVTTSLTGDTIWTVAWCYPVRVDLRYQSDNFSRVNMSIHRDYVKRVRMAEPFDLGAVVQTDEGRAVRFRDHSVLGRRWYLPDAGDSVLQSRSWSELENPRPVDTK